MHFWPLSPLICQTPPEIQTARCSRRLNKIHGYRFNFKNQFYLNLHRFLVSGSSSSLHSE